MKCLSTLFLCAVLSVQVFAEEAKTVDAQAYSQVLKESYIEEDKAVKLPEKLGYSGTPGTKFWRGVRSGISYQTQVRGDDTGVFINADGEYWRLYRNNVATVGGTIIGLSLLLFLLLYLLFGKFGVEGGFSGEFVQRFKLHERILHWGTASLFIVLGITGLILLLGRYLLIPMMGTETFAPIATVAKAIHDVLGPIFSVFLLVMLIRFIKDNFYQPGDVNWVLKGGGLFGKHVASWRFNFGEKVWFWIIFFAGTSIAVTGYILLFTDLVSGQRQVVELSHILHTVSATLMIAVLFGHIYMSIAMDGSLLAMTRGKVDKNWAKQHHSAWYEGKV